MAEKKVWELEAIAKANHTEDGRKRPSEGEMEGLKKRVRSVLEKDTVQKEDVALLIEAISNVCCCVCFSSFVWRFFLLQQNGGLCAASTCGYFPSIHRRSMFQSPRIAASSP